MRAPTRPADAGAQPGGGAGRLNRVYEHVAPSHSIQYTGRTSGTRPAAGEGGEVSEITKAIAARQTQIPRLKGEIETLQHAARIVGTRTKAPVKAASQPKVPAKSKAKSQPKPKAAAKAKPKPKAKGKRRHQWTAAEKAAIGKRMKAYWAKRRRAKG